MGAKLLNKGRHNQINDVSNRKVQLKRLSQDSDFAPQYAQEYNPSYVGSNKKGT